MQLSFPKTRLASGASASIWFLQHFAHRPGDRLPRPEKCLGTCNLLQEDLKSEAPQ